MRKANQGTEDAGGKEYQVFKLSHLFFFSSTSSFWLYNYWALNRLSVLKLIKPEQKLNWTGYWLDCKAYRGGVLRVTCVKCSLGKQESPPRCVCGGVPWGLQPRAAECPQSAAHLKSRLALDRLLEQGLYSVLSSGSKIIKNQEKCTEASNQNSDYL